MLPFLASLLLQTNSTLPSGPFSNLPINALWVAVGVSAILGFLVGMAAKSGTKAGAAVVLIFAILYLVDNQAFPASLLGDLIPFVKDLASSIMGVVGKGGAYSMIGFIVGAAIGYFQLGLQGPVKRPE